ncbi:MAG: DMT family transporter [Clostridia bacterium]|nr:DMT family transporter [Clostridia bacterium]
MEARPKKPLLGAIVLLVATVIWGLSYVAQSDGMRYLGPLTYSCVRILLGGVALVPVVWAFHRFDPRYRTGTKAELRSINRISILGGIVVGVFMCGAATLQQYGIAVTSAGKAGFLTALYIVLVPVFGVFFKRKITWLAAASVLLALIGSYFLCVTGSLTIELGDWLLIGDALLFAFQILFIDFFMARGADAVLLSCTEFLTAGLLLVVPMFLFEQPTWQSVWDAKYTILYAGLASGAVGYTLQVLGQREIEPTAASLLMSLESVFAVLFGWLLLGQALSVRELLGCALVFAAVILSQLPVGKRSA